MALVNTPPADLITQMADEVEMFMQTGLPRVDPETGCLHLSNGKVLKTKQIPNLRLMRVYNDRAGEPPAPTPPFKPMVYAGGITRDEPDPSDPDYLTAHAIWEEEHAQWNIQKQQRLVMFVLLSGIDEPVPEGFAEEAEIFTPYQTTATIKYDYYTTLIPNEDLEWAVEALVGRTLATEDGIEEANRFPQVNGQ